nr:helix-turn-helix domain-containing protein [uncultured Fluviicola sp.]
MNIIKTAPTYLGKHIRCFYSLYSSNTDKLNTTHHRLPDGTLDLVFNLGNTPALISRGGNGFSAIPEVVLTGIYPDSNFLRYQEDVHLVGVVFQPGSAHLFVKDSLEQYRACNAPASLVFGNNINHLLEQLREISGEREKHVLLEHFLLNTLNASSLNHYSQEISSSLQRIHSVAGNISVSELYKDHFMSERTFRRKFNECVGMSPKQYATIIKVKSFSKRYELERSVHAPILDELGYTDQSHFNKDFQKIVGVSPTAYFNQLNQIGEEFIHLI